MPRKPPSEETKRKISETLKSRWKDSKFREEHIQYSLDAIEKTRGEVSEETRQKLSESTKRLWQDDAFKKKTSDAISKATRGTRKGKNNNMHGKHHSDETKKKISEKQKQCWFREDVRAKKIKALKERTPTFLGKSHSEETKKTIGIKAHERFGNEEWRQWYIERRKPMFLRRHWKERQSEARRRLWSTKEFKDKVLSTFINRKPTSLEIKVSEALFELGVVFEEQKVIGRAIVDFYVPNFNLCLEADGYYWHNLPGKREKDKCRDSELTKAGYTIVRLTEKEILEDVEHAVQKVFSNLIENNNLGAN